MIDRFIKTFFLFATIMFSYALATSLESPGMHAIEPNKQCLPNGKKIRRKCVDRIIVIESSKKF